MEYFRPEVFNDGNYGLSFGILGAGQVARILHTRYTLVLATYLTNSRKFRGGNLTTQSLR